MDLTLASEFPVEGDRKAVGFILDPGDQFEAFGIPVNGQLLVLIVEPTGPVIVVLDHAADRNGKSQILKHLQSDIYLSFAAVHQDLEEQGCDCAVLACTELSVFAAQHHLPPFYVDAMAVLAERAVQACHKPLRTIYSK